MQWAEVSQAWFSLLICRYSADMKQCLRDRQVHGRLMHSVLFGATDCAAAACLYTGLLLCFWKKKRQKNYKMSHLHCLCVKRSKTFSWVCTVNWKGFFKMLFLSSSLLLFQIILLITEVFLKTSETYACLSQPQLLLGVESNEPIKQLWVEHKRQWYCPSLPLV